MGYKNPLIWAITVGYHTSVIKPKVLQQIKYDRKSLHFKVWFFESPPPNPLDNSSCIA